MAELKSKVFKPGVEVMSIQAFRQMHGNITSQAVGYAIEKDMVDYVAIDHRIKLIVMTPKTRQYRPNYSPKRAKVSE